MVKLPKSWFSLTPKDKKWAKVYQLIRQASDECPIPLPPELDCYLFPEKRGCDPPVVEELVAELVSEILRCERIPRQRYSVYKGRKMSNRTICILRAIDKFRSKRKKE